MVHGVLDFGQTAQYDDGEHVVGNVVLIARGIVGRPETRPDHARESNPAPLAGVGEIGVAIPRTLVVMLLVTQHRERTQERPIHLRREDRGIVRLDPILVREPDRVQQRVDFELSLDDLIIARKRIRVRVDQHVARLARDDAAQRFANPLIVGGFADVRLHHGAGIAQPFGFNVTG